MEEEDEEDEEGVRRGEGLVVEEVEASCCFASGAAALPVEVEASCCFPQGVPVPAADKGCPCGGASLPAKTFPLSAFCARYAAVACKVEVLINSARKIRKFSSPSLSCCCDMLVLVLVWSTTTLAGMCFQLFEIS